MASGTSVLLFLKAQEYLRFRFRHVPMSVRTLLPTIASSVRLQGGSAMMDGYGKRVLVVEDDDDVRTLIGVILRETGYNVYEACDGLEAIDALKKRRYDVLLTDYHMPKMDGLELLDLTRAMWPELPVILATSDVLLTEQTPNSLLEPAYAILEKPFVRAELLTLIRSAIDGLPRSALHAGVRAQRTRPWHKEALTRGLEPAA
jgi:two-component system, chemotaxis family, chemotaxis protein CheY